MHTISVIVSRNFKNLLSRRLNLELIIRLFEFGSSRSSEKKRKEFYPSNLRGEKRIL